MSTASGREVGRLVSLAFDALGMGEQLDQGGAATISAETLRTPAPQLFTALEELADHGARVLGDTHAGRKRQTLAKARAAKTAPPLKTVAGLVDSALRKAGAHLVAEYRSARDRQKKQPNRYRLAWLWQEDPTKQRVAWMVNPDEPPDEFGRASYYPTPAPIPRHPGGQAPQDPPDE